jgi:ribonuclease HI
MKRSRFHNRRTAQPIRTKPKADRDSYEDRTGEGIVIEFDGSCNPNPGGIASIGYKIYTLSDEGIFGNDCLGFGLTNNIAEWQGLKASLVRVCELVRTREITGDKVIIFGDSQLVIRQLTGQWRVKAEHLEQHKKDCLLLLEAIGLPWVAKWCARKYNTECDALAEQASVRHQSYAALRGE